MAKLEAVTVTVMGTVTATAAHALGSGWDAQSS